MAIGAVAVGARAAKKRAGPHRACCIALPINSHSPRAHHAAAHTHMPPPPPPRLSPRVTLRRWATEESYATETALGRNAECNPTNYFKHSLTAHLTERRAARSPRVSARRAILSHDCRPATSRAHASDAHHGASIAPPLCSPSTRANGRPCRRSHGGAV